MYKFVYGVSITGRWAVPMSVPATPTEHEGAGAMIGCPACDTTISRACAREDASQHFSQWIHLWKCHLYMHVYTPVYAHACTRVYAHATHISICVFVHMSILMSVHPTSMSTNMSIHLLYACRHMHVSSYVCSSV